MTTIPRFWDIRKKRDATLLPKEKKDFLKLILSAKRSKAFPSQSGFYVKTAILTGKGDVESGGNAEHAFSDGFLHSETSALAKVLSKYGIVKLKALAFYGHFSKTKDPIRGPCGNCRDVLCQYASRDMFVIKGDGKFNLILQFGDYLFEKFKEIDIRRVDKLGYKEAEKAIRIGVEAYLPKHLKAGVYGSAIVAKSGTVWQGSLDTNAGYDATTPLVAARQAWRNMGPEAELKKIVIARYGALPRPLYRDRQTILELDESLMDHTGRKTPLPIELVELSRSGKVVRVALTDTLEWLPIPFTAASFGMKKAVKGGLRGLFAKKIH